MVTICRMKIVGATCRWVMVASICAMAWSSPLTAGGQDLRRGLPPLAPDSLVGSVSFDLYCAACHGREGTGNGPASLGLRTSPADLTMLARRNRGVFPRERVLSFIEGSQRAEPIHGTPDMPVWGPTLRALDGSTSRANVRLQNLVAFIESIQAPMDAAASKGVEPNGAVLFKAYCETCHGSQGRGNGVMAGQMRRPPADLTRLAMRNGGVLPSERLRQIISGVGVAAHGDREMPLWGRLFTPERDGKADPATARMDAIVKYLESIQERPAE